MATTKLTPEIQSKLVGMIRRGNFVSVAVRALGLHRDTYYEWLRRGEAGEQPFSDFTDAVRQAEALAEVDALSFLERAARKGDVRAVQYFLERRFPRRWAKQDAKSIDLKVTTATAAEAVALDLVERELGLEGGGAGAAAAIPGE